VADDVLSSTAYNSFVVANEAVLQAIVEILLPSRHKVPELCLVIDGKKRKGSGHFGFLDIFVLGGTEGNVVCLELKFILLIGLVRDVGNQVRVLGANELEKLNKILEMEDMYIGQRILEKRKGSFGYSTSGVFDEPIKIIKSGSNKLEGFCRILWRPINEMISNYKYIY
ncbi:10856_t:CDS:2, partial [Cetraspora pellucida]